MSKLSLTEVQEKVEAAVEAIATLPHGQRAGWICYLLEALDTYNDVYHFLLEAVAENINTRLNEGRW